MSRPEWPGGKGLATRRSYLLPLLGGGAFVIAVIVLLTGWAILQGRADAHHTAEVATANVSRILADNFDSTIDKVDLGLQAIGDEIVRQQKEGRRDDEALAAVMARQHARNSEIVGFRVFGADGKLRMAVNNVANSGSDLSDREDFKALRDTPSIGLVVTHPLFGQTTRQWVIAVARRINNPDGSFGGAVYGPIPISLLTAIYGGLDLGPGGTVALYHSSLRMAARFPEVTGPNNPVGTVTISDKLRAIITSNAPLTQYDYTSVVDGVLRTANVRRLDPYPYFILVGQSEDHYLADWRRNRLHFLLFGALATVLVIAGMAFFSRRMSDWLSATRALAEQTEMLTQSNADLEQFAYVSSHDLQTPLRNIVSYTQLLERRYKGRLDADADDFIGFIVDSSKQMSRLITDLLEYSRVASQGKPLEPINSGQAVAAALATLRPDMEKTGAEVTVGRLPTVMAEEARLTSLFQNLLNNAVKYRSPDRPPRISVTAELVGPRWWRFAVADNGIGIEPQYFDKIFEIFQRLDPGAETEGTGIGLALCRRIVQRLGGTMWVDSVPGKGTTFYFTLKDGGAS